MIRRGFTLIEVLTALTLAGLSFLVIARLVSASARLTLALDDRRRALDTDMNAERWLGRALESVSIGAEGAEPFGGTDSTLRVTAWVPTSDGWPARRTMEVRLRNNVVEVSLGDGAEVALWERVAELHLEYLLVPGESSRWVPMWSSPVSAPVAIRVRLFWSDTLRAQETLLLAVRGGQ